MKGRRFVAALRCALLVLVVTTRVFANDAPTFADREDDATEDADATVAVMFAPLAIACGVFGGEADFVVQRALALSVDAVGYRPDGATLGAVGVGLLVYPLRSVFHGLYLEPRVIYAHALSQTLPSGPGALSVEAVSGWQWTWDYGLTIRFGAGVAGSTGGGSAIRAPDVSLGRLALVADAGLGWVW
jgi:hypothetical protein